MDADLGQKSSKFLFTGDIIAYVENLRDQKKKKKPPGTNK